MSSDNGGRPGDGLVVRMVRGLAAHPWLGLLAILTATGGALWYGSGVEIRKDIEDLLPDHTPAVVRAREAREIVGQRSVLLVLLGSPKQELNRAVAEELATAFEAHRATKLIERVVVRRDKSFFKKNAALYGSLEDVREAHDQVKERIAEIVLKKENEGEDWGDDEDWGGDEEEPKKDAADGGKGEDEEEIPTIDELLEKYGGDALLREYFESPDGEVIGIKVFPTFKPADTAKTRKLTDAVEGDIERVLAKYPDDKIEVALEGDYAHTTAAVNQLKSESLTALGIALAGISLILIGFFRRLRATLSTLIPLVVGLAWTFFFARVAIGYLNIITIFIFSIMVGLGIDFVVHGSSRADEEFHSDRPLGEALATALARLGRAMLVAALTTSATFVALMVFDFRGFSQFGLIAGIGVLVCLGCVYLVLPPLEVAFAKVVKRKPRPAPPEPTIDAPAPASRFGAGLGWGLVAAAVGPVALAAAFLPGLDFEADTRKMRSKTQRKTSELRRKYTQEAEKRSTSPALYITDDRVAAEQLHRRLDAALEQEERWTEHPEEHPLHPFRELMAEDVYKPILDDVKSIYSFVPEQQAKKLDLIRETKRLIDNKYALLEGKDKERADEFREYLEPEAFGVDQLPDWLKDEFRDRNGTLGRYVLAYVKGPKSNAKHVLKIRDRIGLARLVDDRDVVAAARWLLLGDASAAALAEVRYRHKRMTLDRARELCGTELWERLREPFTLAMATLYDPLGRAGRADSREVHATASWLLLGEAFTVVRDEAPWAVGLACLVVLLFLAVDLRSFRDVTTVFLPLVVGFVVFLGILAAAGIELNIFNIVVLPTIFGIGVDTGVHILHRLNEGTPLGRTMRTTGAAAAVSSLTTAVGFGALVFVSNEGLQSIGWVALIGVLTCYVSCVALISASVLIGWKRPVRPQDG